jgi:hypothetical protein
MSTTQFPLLTRISFTSRLLLAIFIVGLLGLDGTPLFGGALPNAPRLRRSPSVFSAAPLSVTLVDRSLQSSQRKLPPAYVISSDWITQRTQFKPSKACVTEGEKFSSEMTTGASGGTMGSSCSRYTSDRNFGPSGCCVGGLVWAKAECTRVIVWLPRNSGPSTSPTANDPNAKAVLDITPPSSGKAGNCSVWEYRYGEPPPLKAPRRKRHPIIPPKEVPGSTIHDPSTPLPSRV